MFHLAKTPHLGDGEAVFLKSQIDSPLMDQLNRNLIECFENNNSIIYLSGATYHLDIGEVPVSQGSLAFFDGYAFIYNVCTIPAYRRRGLCRTLLQFLLSDLPLKTRVFLEVDLDNFGAIELYSSLGFTWCDLGVMSLTKR